MCSLNKKYHPFFEPLHKTALAHFQAFLSFEVHLPSFLSNIDEKLSVLTLWLFWLFLHLYHQEGGPNIPLSTWQTLTPP